MSEFRDFIYVLAIIIGIAALGFFLAWQYGPPSHMPPITMAVPPVTAEPPFAEAMRSIFDEGAAAAADAVDHSAGHNG